MLRNYYKSNRIVTNGNSGIENYIVKSGHQIVHAPNGAGTCPARALLCAWAIYTRGTSWKAGSWNKLEAETSWKL